MASNYDQLRASVKSLYLIQHRDDSDDQLRETMVNNARIAQGLPPAQIAEGYKLLGEIDACNEILKERKEAKEKIAAGKKEYESSLDRRRDDALLTLKAAPTPNGQLVAAILEEEDGKTAEELAGWCDELDSLDDADFRALLSDLVDDGIIEKREDGKYYLRVVLTDKVQWDVDAVMRYVYGHMTGKGKDIYRSAALGVAGAFMFESEPLSAARCVELEEEYAEYPDLRALMHPDGSEAHGKITYRGALHTLERAGVLDFAFMGGGSGTEALNNKFFDLALIRRKEAEKE